VNFLKISPNNFLNILKIIDVKLITIQVLGLEVLNNNIKLLLFNIKTPVFTKIYENKWFNLGKYLKNNMGCWASIIPTI